MPPPLISRDQLPDAPLCVALSGGLDSVVLLHALAALSPPRLRALHVHHGLHAGADAWAEHCRTLCKGVRVPLHTVRVQVRPRGLGPEGDARAARREAFAEALADGGVLALAHHADDQAETFLLRALRASGPDGLGAMSVHTPFAAGSLWRPLLHTPREALRAYAQRHALAWIDDPSNADASLDRNFLRLHVLPLLRTRWPHAADALARSAALSAGAAALLSDEDTAALAGCMAQSPDTLSLAALRALPAPRRARALRRWVASLGLPPLPARGVNAVEHELLDARSDASARFDWNGARLQAWRDRLHAGQVPLPWPSGWSAAWDGRTPLALPCGGALSLHGADGFDLPLRVRARRGGERIRLPGRAHSHALKHALPEAGVAPWERERLPLLVDAADDVLAAGDRLHSAAFHDWLNARGAWLHWRAG